jgi:hypothetical protein
MFTAQNYSEVCTGLLKPGTGQGRVGIKQYARASCLGLRISRPARGVVYSTSGGVLPDSLHSSMNTNTWKHSCRVSGETGRSNPARAFKKALHHINHDN